MNDLIYQSLCKIYNFDKNSGKISYGVNKFFQPVDKKGIYQAFLFEFCFLLKSGSIEFKDLNDIWFFKTFNEKEIEVALHIITTLIKKIENDNVGNDVLLETVEKFINLYDYKKYMMFKRLQSIYSYYQDNIEYVIFPLIFTIGFDNQILRKFLKNDLMDIVGNFIFKIDKDDNIIYDIDDRFLADLNRLIYYFNFNMKNPKNEKDINPLYNYLCTKKDLLQNHLDLEELYPEEFNYFTQIKIILIEHDKKYKNKIETAQKNPEAEIEEKKIINLNNKEKNGTNNNNNSNKEQAKNIDLSKIRVVDNFIDINFMNDLIEEKVRIGIDKYSKFNELNKLCENIPLIIKEMNLNKDSIDIYYKLAFEIAENKLLINKLSSTILLMKTPIKANIKRKLTEVIPFNIMEKYKNYFSFKNNYYPSTSNLKDLKSFICEKMDNCKDEKVKAKINGDKEKIENFIKIYKDKKIDNDCIIKIYDKNKIGRQISMVINFLRFCKKHYNPIVHASKKALNYYLLPNCVFSSNLKYADYVFSLTDIIQDENNDKDKNDNKSKNNNKVNNNNINKTINKETDKNNAQSKIKDNGKINSNDKSQMEDDGENGSNDKSTVEENEKHKNYGKNEKVDDNEEVEGKISYNNENIDKEEDEINEENENDDEEKDGIYDINKDENDDNEEEEIDDKKKRNNNEMNDDNGKETNNIKKENNNDYDEEKNIHMDENSNKEMNSNNEMNGDNGKKTNNIKKETNNDNKNDEKNINKDENNNKAMNSNNEINGDNVKKTNNIKKETNDDNENDEEKNINKDENNNKAMNTNKENNDDNEENGNKISFEKIIDDKPLYKDEKIISIKEALEILFSTKIKNNLNEINIDKIIESKKSYQNKLRVFNKNIDPLLKILPFEEDKKFKLNEDMKNKEPELFNQLNTLDVSISNIIADNLKHEEAENIIKSIKELINIETKDLKLPYSKFQKLNIDIDSKENRIYLLLNFLQKQKEKIDNARENICRDYENYLNILIEQTNEYKDYLRDFVSEGVNLFDEWAKLVAKNYKGKRKKFLQLDVLMNNFCDLLTSVKLDIDYSYDEKFSLWTIKNDLSGYLK